LRGWTSFYETPAFVRGAACQNKINFDRVVLVHGEVIFFLDGLASSFSAGIIVVLVLLC
jgi:hypothetical protein